MGSQLYRLSKSVSPVDDRCISTVSQPAEERSFKQKNASLIITQVQREIQSTQPIVILTE